MDPFIIPIVAISFGCGIPIVKIITNHLMDIERLKQSRQVVAPDNAAIESLRREIMQLRDTTTQYDMTVERSLNQITSRLSNLEGKIGVESSIVEIPTPVHMPSPMPVQVAIPLPQPVVQQVEVPIVQTINAGT